MGARRIENLPERNFTRMTSDGTAEGESLTQLQLNFGQNTKPTEMAAHGFQLIIFNRKASKAAIGKDRFHFGDKIR